MAQPPCVELEKNDLRPRQLGQTLTKAQSLAQQDSLEGPYTEDQLLQKNQTQRSEFGATL
jgi:hypothetical protein